MFLAAMATGQIPRPLWDGYDWQQVDRLTAEYPEYRLPLKRAYVTGLLDGKFYYFLQVWGADSTVANQAFKDYLNRYSVDELVRGADEFYKDPANRYLPVLSALIITTLKATDLPDSSIAAYTQASRDWVNRLANLLFVEIPIPLEGIARPAGPKTPYELIPADSSGEPRRWYFPDAPELP